MDVRVVELEFDLGAFLKCLAVVLVSGFIPYSFLTSSPWGILALQPNDSTLETLFTTVTIYPLESRMMIVGHFTLARLLVALVVSALPMLHFYIHLTRPESSLRVSWIPAAIYLGLMNLFQVPTFILEWGGEDYGPWGLTGPFGNPWNLIPTIFLCTMVLLPMFDREITHRYGNAYSQIPSREFELRMAQKKRVRKARLVGLVVAMMTLVVPAVVLYNFEIGELAAIPPYTWFLSVTMYLDYQNNMLQVYALPPLAMLITAAVAAFNFVFARRLLRYYYGEGERSAVLRAGVLGLAWATLLTVLPQLFVVAPLSYISLAIPNPALLILGLIVMRYQDPAAADPILEIDESQLRGDEKIVFEENVKVPFAYLVYSHLRNRLRRGRSEEDHESSISL
ncbi:MAG: hypothetical protein JSW61_07135 [Candidatus Thorarchaeota archaeon]|nr:MAG: hypothetical protein JSW61_07135 [Candidatus Thorarchaeota archaeon]